MNSADKMLLALTILVLFVMAFSSRVSGLPVSINVSSDAYVQSCQNVIGAPCGADNTTAYGVTDFRHLAWGFNQTFVTTLASCTGTASPCSTWNGNQVVCLSQTGCTWKGSTCSGTHAACSTYSELVCPTQYVCSWNAGGTTLAELSQRTFAYFDLRCVPANASLLNAQLTFVANYSTPAGYRFANASLHNVTPIQFTVPWDEATVTWDTQPAVNTSSWGNGVKTESEAPGWFESDLFYFNTTCSFGVCDSILANLITGWFNTSAGNYGVRINRTETSSQSYWTVFTHSANDTMKTYSLIFKPYISLQYDWLAPRVDWTGFTPLNNSAFDPTIANYSYYFNVSDDGTTVNATMNINGVNQTKAGVVSTTYLTPAAQTCGATLYPTVANFTFNTSNWGMGCQDGYIFVVDDGLHKTQQPFTLCIQAGSVTGCGNLTSSGTYGMGNDIYSTLGKMTAYCINVGANDIIFDCQSYNLFGNGTGMAVFNNGYDNITIKNCGIMNFTSGVYFNNTANDSVIYNNTIKNTTRIGTGASVLNSYGGVVLDTGGNGNVSYNYIENATPVTPGDTPNGIYVSGSASTNNWIAYNYLFFNYYGIKVVSSAVANTIFNNTIANSTTNGVYVSADSNNVSYNVINYTSGTGSGNGGVYSGSTSSSISFNRISFSSRSGVVYDGASTDTAGASAYNNTIFNNTAGGIEMDGAFVSFYDNTIDNHTAGAGFNVTALSKNVSFYRNTISNSYRGMHFVDLQNSTFTNNTISSASTSSVHSTYSASGSINNYFLNNTLDKSKITWGSSGNNNLTIAWFARAYTTYCTNGTVVSGANVNISTKDGIILYNETSDANGYTTERNITEWAGNGTVNYGYNYTPHWYNATASNTEGMNSSVEITQSQTVNVCFNVPSAIDLTLVDYLVNFANVSNRYTYDTSVGTINSSGAVPFLMRSDSSTDVNITLSATQFFSQASDNSSYYRFNATNATGNASVLSNCNTVNQNTWYNVPISSSTWAICGFGYLINRNYAKVEIQITVPDGEGAGSKSSSATFTGSQA